MNSITGMNGDAPSRDCSGGAQMNEAERELARHALGLTRGRNVSYRNHFVTGPGCEDHDHWRAMEARGLAWSRRGSPLSGGDPIFGLTRVGAELALDSGEHLDPEAFPPLRPVSPQPSTNGRRDTTILPEEERLS